MKASWAKQLVGFLALLISVFAMQPMASAEWYADVYGGGAFTKDAKYRQMREGLTLDAKLEVDESLTGGGRAGYWFEGLPWYGVGVDVFYFKPKFSDQTVFTNATFLGASATGPVPFFRSSVSVIAIGLDVLRLRLPLLKSPQYPHGQLQPYVTAGPALFIARVEDSANVFIPSNQSKTDGSWGLKVGGGVAFHITKHLALFLEYRFTQFKVERTYLDQSLLNPNNNAEVTTQARFDTHHGIGGLSFRF